MQRGMKHHQPRGNCDTTGLPLPLSVTWFLPGIRAHSSNSRKTPTPFPSPSPNPISSDQIRLIPTNSGPKNYFLSPCTPKLETMSLFHSTSMFGLGIRHFPSALPEAWCSNRPVVLTQTIALQPPSCPIVPNRAGGGCTTPSPLACAPPLNPLPSPAEF